MIRITHHRHKCIGCYYCAEVAPERWQMNEDDGKSSLKEAEKNRDFYTVITSDDELEANRDAESVCPVKIIRVEQL